MTGLIKHYKYFELETIYTGTTKVRTEDERFLKCLNKKTIMSMNSNVRVTPGYCSNDVDNPVLSQVTSKKKNSKEKKQQRKKTAKKKKRKEKEKETNIQSSRTPKRSLKSNTAARHDHESYTG
jgi:hypothetical protein